MTKAKRQRVMVRWRNGRGFTFPGRWYLSAADALKSFERKVDAVREGVLWAKAVTPSELVIYRKDGRIQDARSYGTDPSRSKG